MRLYQPNLTSLAYLVPLFTGLLIGSLGLTGCSSMAPPSAWQIGQKQLQQGQISEARRSFERELQEHPENLQARYNLAILLTEAGHAADAEELYRKNLAIDWHFPSAINLARHLQSDGKIEEAISLLKEATEESPHEATPWYLLGDISLAGQHQEQAKTYYHKALQADPANGYAHLHLARFQAYQLSGDLGAAEGEKAVQLLPLCAPCWREYGDIMMQSKAYSKAQAAYQHSLAIRPDVETRQRLIDALRQTGHTEQANRMQQALDAWRLQYPDMSHP